MIRYGSVCSGIEAATVAWKPLGWKPVFFAEIEKFPSAVLKHHYPEVPNLGDFTKIEATDATAIDLLVGGTPCQDFSVAGLRAGLDGERGNLSLEFLKLAQRLRPRWVVWENVPGVQSSWTDDAARVEDAQNEQLIAEARRAGELLGLDIGFGGSDSGDGDFEEVVQTNDLSVFLEGLSELGYGWSYRILDAQYAGVPQRRRRVFVVGHLGSWERPAAVLFERHSLSGYPPPRREARQRVARGVAVGPSGGEFTETSCTLDTRCKDGAIRNQLGMLAVDGNSVAGGADRWSDATPVTWRSRYAVCIIWIRHPRAEQ